MERRLRQTVPLLIRAMSLLEIIAFLLGVINILLIIRRSIWNYPYGIAMVALYAVIFAQAKLYSDAGLQVFFFVANIYGWWAWVGNKKLEGDVKIIRLHRLHLAYWAAGSFTAIVCWGSFMHHFTDASYPYWDASVAMLSIAGQILMARRALENWWWWIVVNVISLPLYFAKGLYLTVGLYAIFLVLAIIGLREWQRSLKTQNS